jgi:hypothetical protein
VIKMQQIHPTKVLQRAMIGWQAIKRDPEPGYVNKKELEGKKVIDSFPMFLDEEFGQMVDFIGEPMLVINKDAEYLPFIPAPHGTVGIFEVCQWCGDIELIATQVPGLELPLHLREVILEINAGRRACQCCNECPVCKEEQETLKNKEKKATNNDDDLETADTGE